MYTIIYQWNNFAIIVCRTYTMKLITVGIAVQ